VMCRAGPKPFYPGSQATTSMRGSTPPARRLCLWWGRASLRVGQARVCLRNLELFPACLLLLPGSFLLPALLRPNCRGTAALLPVMASPHAWARVVTRSAMPA